MLNLINSFDKDKNWEIYELRKDHPWKDKLMFEPRILQASTYGFLAELLKSEVMNLKLGNKTLNGKLMFIYQALSAFKIWHGLEPDVNENVTKLLD